MIPSSLWISYIFSWWPQISTPLNIIDIIFTPSYHHHDSIITMNIILLGDWVEWHIAIATIPEAFTPTHSTQSPNSILWNSQMCAPVFQAIDYLKPLMENYIKDNDGQKDLINYAEVCQVQFWTIKMLLRKDGTRLKPLTSNSQCFQSRETQEARKAC